MVCSASGTYSLPSACMKSYWVSTSQKMTRAIDRPCKVPAWGNLSGEEGGCQQARRLDGEPSRLQPQHHSNFVAAVLPGAPRAIRPHLEREVLPLGGHEAELLEERGLAGEGEHLGEAVGARLRHELLEHGAADPRALPVGPDGEPRHFGERAGVQ